ncbi:glucosaminidase domain-containing protein [Xanthobacter sp. AM11]|uniref:glucosaminidase domain-containing protein n=1 Tax=Xanthobacter sp. AM11 TaxID=3380643 RepID=UPI0039BEE91C
MTSPGSQPLSADRRAALVKRLDALRSRIAAPGGEEAVQAPAGLADDAAEQRWALREELEDLAAGMAVAAAAAPQAALEATAAAAPDGLAVMVGHTRASPGAKGACPPFAPDDRFEYGWNSDLARRIHAVATAQGIRCQIFTRDGTDIEGSYAPVRQWRPAATVELHFNWAESPTAKGTLTLFGAEESRAWAKQLQEAMVALYDRQGHSEDRGIQMPGPGSGYARGTQNVVQIHPSALIEPFFGHNPVDARLGITLKQNLAEAIVAAYAAFAGRPVRPVAPGPDVAGDGPALPGGPLFARLRQALEAMPLSIPDLDADTARSLKSIVLAQWAEESGWGTSALSAEHFNFAGMKALSEVDAILTQLSAQKVWYEAHDGFDWYLRFGRLEDFITGYFMFLDRSPYGGWRAAARRSPHDFIRFIGRVWSNGNPGYADRIISIERRILAAAPPVPAEPAGDHGGDGALNMAVIPADARLFAELVSRHLPADADLARVKAVLAAQWAVESNWGRSALAVQHFNFAGIEWSDRLAGIAARVPHPTSPEKGDFCRFLDLARFAEGYVQRLERDPAFAGWRARTAAPADFIAFLSQAWRPSDPGYARALADRHRDLSRAAAPGPADDGAPQPQMERRGFVLRLTRTHCERAADASFDRTVSRYAAFFDGAPLPGLSGIAFERQGPGDNSQTGVQAHRRVRAGAYALSTHSGSRTDDAGVTLYKTIGFTDSTAAGAAPRPSVRLMDTGARSGILFHPGQGYLWSVGCFNLSRPLGDLGAIEWNDSRTRVIALIDAMRERLGPRFPAANNAVIADAVMIIENEPGPAGTREGAPVRSTAGFGLQQMEAVREEMASATAAAASPAQIFHLVASALIGPAEAGMVEDGTVDNIIAGVDDLAGLRDMDGATVWSPFVTACAVAGALSNPATRAPLLARLDAIAARFAARGVPLDDMNAPHTPMVEAAIADSPAALVLLHRHGAALDRHDRAGVTPLLAGALHGCIDAVRFLLDRGADPRAVSRRPAPADPAHPEREEAAATDALPAGLDAMGCAQAGKRLMDGNEEMLDRYEAVISLLWSLDH